MNVEEVKLAISDKTKIPIDMIYGSTPEEAFAYSKTLLAYKKSSQESTPKSKEERFGEYLFGSSSQAEHSEIDALMELQMELGLRDSYPAVNDGGNLDIHKQPDFRSPFEKFNDFLNKSSF